MKVGLVSDLHKEHGYEYYFDFPDDLDVLLLAGDIHAGTYGMEWAIAQNWPFPVVYVRGNHEAYHYEHHELNQLLRDASTDKVKFLENDSFEVKGYTILGCTLWTDYRINSNIPADLAMLEAQNCLNDHRLISIEVNGKEEPFRAYHALDMHKQSLAWLKQELTSRDRAKTIVVTHHAPTGASVAPRFVGDSLNGAFGSNLDNFILDSGPIIWAWGHTHWDVDIQIGDTRAVSRQAGYNNGRERAASGQPPFEPLIIELPDLV